MSDKPDFKIRVSELSIGMVGFFACISVIAAAAAYKDAAASNAYAVCVQHHSPPECAR